MILACKGDQNRNNLTNNHVVILTQVCGVRVAGFYGDGGGLWSDCTKVCGVGVVFVPVFPPCSRQTALKFVELEWLKPSTCSYLSG